jgi:hypothetical protein
MEEKESVVTKKEETYLLLKYGEHYESRIVEGYFKEGKNKDRHFKSGDLERRVMNQYVIKLIGDK